jgi:hypothetical protein
VEHARVDRLTVTYKQCLTITYKQCLTITYKQWLTVTYKQCLTITYKQCLTITYKQCLTITYKQCVTITHKQCLKYIRTMLTSWNMRVSVRGTSRTVRRQPKPLSVYWQDCALLWNICSLFYLQTMLKIHTKNAYLVEHARLQLADVAWSHHPQLSSTQLTGGRRGTIT